MIRLIWVPLFCLWTTSGAAPQHQFSSYCIKIGVGSCTRYHIQFRNEMKFSVKSCARLDVLLQPLLPISIRACAIVLVAQPRTPKRFHLKSEQHTHTHTSVLQSGRGRLSLWKSYLVARKYKCKQRNPYISAENSIPCSLAVVVDVGGRFFMWRHQVNYCVHNRVFAYTV